MSTEAPTTERTLEGGMKERWRDEEGGRREQNRRRERKLETERPRKRE